MRYYYIFYVIWSMRSVLIPLCYDDHDETEHINNSKRNWVGGILRNNHFNAAFTHIQSSVWLFSRVFLVTCHRFTKSNLYYNGISSMLDMIISMNASNWWARHANLSCSIQKRTHSTSLPLAVGHTRKTHFRHPIESFVFGRLND